MNLDRLIDPDTRDYCTNTGQAEAHGPRGGPVLVADSRSRIWHQLMTVRDSFAPDPSAGSSLSLIQHAHDLDLVRTAAVSALEPLQQDGTLTEVRITVEQGRRNGAIVRVGAIDRNGHAIDVALGVRL